MRAVWYADFGPADVLQSGDMDAPEPGAGQVRIHVVASGINPVDIKRRRGGRGDMPAPQVIPHFDGAGIIDRVGEGVSETRVSQRVWIYEAQWEGRQGTAAEYVVVPDDRAVPLPDTVDFAEGACIGIPAMTAHRCVFADGPVDGQTILVTGGAGMVGGYAVQFARLGGATVITTVSDDGKADLAASYGAHHIINYKTEDVSQRVHQITGGAGVDRIVEVEFGGNLDTSLAVLRNSGIIAAYASDAVMEPALPFYRLVYKNITVHHVLVFVMPEAAKQQAISDITGWLETGKLRHHVGQRFALSDAAAAHDVMENKAHGKVILETG